MTDDETLHIGKPDAEFRRQMRSGQMKRFVNALPGFSIERKMPAEFARLLRELDRTAKPDAARKTPGRQRNH